MWDLRTLTAINDRVVAGEPPLTLGRATLEEPAPTPDFSVDDQGTLVIINPRNMVAEEYLLSIVPEEVNRWCSGVVVEPRYVQPILDDLMANGFTVRA